jgi:hypothetical protein
MTFSRLAVYLAWAGSLCGQTDLRGPISGFLFDPPSHSIRPVVGIPGAAYLGNPVVRDLQFASVAPNGKWALGISGGAVFITGLRDNTLSSRLEEVVIETDLVVWSLDSTAAVLYSPARGLLQTVRQLDATPRIDPPVDLSQLGGVITRVALDRTAQRIAVGIQNAPVSGIYLISGVNSPVLLVGADDPGAMVFSEDGNLYAANMRTPRITRLENVSTLPVAPLFLDQQEGLADIVGMALSRDGRRLYVASREKRTVCVYDTVDRSLLANLPLDAPPSVLEPLSGSDLFFLNTRGSTEEPILLVDTRSTAVYFVPASPLPQSDARGGQNSEN